MLRLFKQHELRPTVDLAGMWTFYPDQHEDEAQLMPVPGCWEQQPNFRNYRGVGIYHKSVSLAHGANLRLEFKGVSHTADVYFDGQLVGHHYNAYTPFAVILPRVAAGEHQLEVRVDNSFSEASALHVPNDYYSYGGITRGVELQEIGDVYLKYLHFSSQLVAGQWQGTVTAQLANITAQVQTVDLHAQLQQQKLAVTGLSVPAKGELTVSRKIGFADVQTWTPAQPHLYLLTASLLSDGQEIDDLIERVGFRQVTMQGNRLYLNGQSLFLKGFNRHEDSPTFGCALPFSMMAHDLALMKDLGANAVRTCHYPNDELFLDLCDETGFLVWEENHARGLSVEKMNNPHFDEQCRDCNREMVTNHYNHPAIVIWGLLNECASNTEVGRRKYQQQYDQLRELDQTRPLTSATCYHFSDICLDLPDVVSVNVYAGWYEDGPVADRWTKEMDWIAQTPGAGKPVIVSEFGAGAIYGDRDVNHSKWSEERQTDILKDNLDVYLNDERITGVFIWQFADCRVSEEGWFSSRPRTYNNKGVVDEYRRPKEAYALVKAMYTQARE